MNVKAGFVSIIGKPNVGKSTLMNALIGEKLSITTHKPQTTRKKIIGILSSENYQIIFQDMPGILNPEYLLQERMYDYILEAVKDADLLLFMVDISTDPTGQRTLSDERVHELLKDKSIKKLLLINKIDLVSQNEVEALIRQLEKNDLFEKIIPVLATANYNLQTVIDTILEYLPEHPKYFPDDQLSDANERFFVSEIIREKIFEMYQEEIPYSTEVIVEEFKERENAKDYIRAVIVVEKGTQKPIIIGSKGEMIKKLGRKAREAIEAFLGREVYLELFVKVREKWRSNPLMLKSFGYIKPDEK